MILKNQIKPSIKEDEVILVIPTRNRPEQLRSTLEAYVENLNRFKHDIPILIIDGSDDDLEDKVRQIVSDIAEKNRREIYFVGKQETLEYFSQLVAKLDGKVPKDVLANCLGIDGNTVTHGFGYARNLTLLYSLGKIMISADDDCPPTRIKLKEKQYADKDNSDVFCQRATAEPRLYDISNVLEFVNDIDVVSLLTEYISKRASDLATILKGKSFTPATFGTGNLRVVGKFHSVDGRVIAAAPIIDWDDDIRAIDNIGDYIRHGAESAMHGQNPKKHVTTSLEPVVLEQIPFNACVYSLDLRGHVQPFMPTSLRGEDLIYFRMLPYLFNANGKEVVSIFGTHSQVQLKSNERPSAIHDAKSEVIGNELGRIILECLEESLPKHKKHREFYTNLTVLGDLLSSAAKRYEASKDLVSKLVLGAIELRDDLIEEGCWVAKGKYWKNSPDPQGFIKYALELQEAFYLPAASEKLKPTKADERYRKATRVKKVEMISKKYPETFQRFSDEINTRVREDIMKMGLLCKYWSEIIKATGEIEMPAYNSKLTEEK